MVEAVNVDPGVLVAGLFLADHFGVDAVVRGVGEDFEERIESLALGFRYASLLADGLALLDERIDEVVTAGIDLHLASEPDGSERAGFAAWFEGDVSEDRGCASGE